MVSLGLYLRDFREFLSSDAGKRLVAVAEKKKKAMQAALGKENFPKLNEESASQIFANLEPIPKKSAPKIFDSLLLKYGLETLKGEFYYFLYGDRPIEERFDEVRKAIPDLPAEVLLEIATFTAPRDFCIWNSESRETIKFVGQSRMHGLSEEAFAGEISGWNYVACKTALNQVKEQLRSYLQRRADFVDVSLFCRFLYENEIGKLMKAEKNRG